MQVLVGESVTRTKTEHHRSARNLEHRFHGCKLSSLRRGFSDRNTWHQVNVQRSPRRSRWLTLKSRRGSKTDAPSGGHALTVWFAWSRYYLSSKNSVGFTNLGLHIQTAKHFRVIDNGCEWWWVSDGDHIMPCCHWHNIQSAVDCWLQRRPNMRRAVKHRHTWHTLVACYDAITCRACCCCCCCCCCSTSVVSSHALSSAMPRCACALWRSLVLNERPINVICRVQFLQSELLLTEHRALILHWRCYVRTLLAAVTPNYQFCLIECDVRAVTLVLFVLLLLSLKLQSGLKVYTQATPK